LIRCRTKKASHTTTCYAKGVCNIIAAGGEALDTNKLKRGHKSTLFREYFKIAPNFLHLLEKCRGGHNLTEGDITPFDLESETALRFRRNDVSFITKDNRLIILVEHQSTVNLNMAFRLFLYYTELLQLWIKQNNVNLYGTKLIEPLPEPEFYVAYNGTEKLKETTSQFRLNRQGVKIEVDVEILDIHFENLDDTQPKNALAGYSYLYKRYDEHLQKGFSRQKAFEAAREECINLGYMPGFIEKEEYVMDYKENWLDYDFQLRAEGEAKMLELAKALMRGMPPKQVATEYSRSVEEVERIGRELDLLPL
jgi:hypothetical protein